MRERPVLTIAFVFVVNLLGAIGRRGIIGPVAAGENAGNVAFGNCDGKGTGMIGYKCGHCGTRLESPDSMAGQSERCSECGIVVAVPGRAGSTRTEENPYRALETTPVRPAPRPAQSVSPAPTPQQDVSALEELTAGREPNYGRRPIIRSGSANQGEFFAPEKRGLEKGVLGGLAMMVIAVVWFVLGLKANLIFYYPPILFVIGLFGFLKGMVTGNVAGKKTPTG